MQRITFLATTRVTASVEAIFDWHEAPDAFERLTPPWKRGPVLRHQCIIHHSPLGRLIGEPFVPREQRRLFAYRHAGQNA